MYKEILLFMNWLFATFFSIKYRDRYTKIYKGLKPTLLMLIIYCIIVPIVEESLFRSTLFNLTNHLKYHKALNSFLFGLMHMSNYFTTKNLRNSILQSVFALYVGYYLIDLDNILLAMLIHCSYNFSVYAVLMVFEYFFDLIKGEKWVSNNFCNVIRPISPLSQIPVSTSNDESIPAYKKYESDFPTPFRKIHYLSFDKLKKSKSTDDLPKSSVEKIDEFYYVHEQNRVQRRTIFVDGLPKDIQQSFENFDKAVEQKRNTFYGETNIRAKAIQNSRDIFNCLDSVDPNKKIQ